MALDWTKLQPHQALDLGDARYVEPPITTGRTLADWLRAGTNTLLLVGPVGSGKSTQLARAAKLSTSSVACLLRVDLVENLRKLTRDKLLATMAVALVSTAKVNGLTLSPSVEGVWAERARLENADTSRESHAENALLEACREVARISSKRVTFFVDGLEKAEQGVIRSALGALADVTGDVGLVVVVPLAGVYGRREDLLRAGERVVTHGPVRGPNAVAFFRELIGRRLGSSWDELARSIGGDIANDVKRLQIWSSGLPRDFLQLAAEAGTYARLSGGADWPSPRDFESARNDFVESFRRALLPGDEEALRSMKDTDGRELDLERKLRMLTQGMLVEVDSDTSPATKVMQPHALVRPLIEKRRG